MIRSHVAVLGVALLLLGSGCAANKTRQLGLEDLQIEFVGFELQQDQVSRAQPVITVTPTLMLRNPNDVSVNLEKLELELRGVQELIQLDQKVWPVDKAIAAGATIQHRVNIFATLRSSQTNVMMHPLYVSGRAYFTSSKGSFSQGFVKQQSEIEDAADE